MRAVFVAARAAVARRRLQSVIVGMVVLLSAATSVVAIGLLVLSNGPYDAAFAKANGAHVTAAFAPTVTSAALAATASAQGVSATAGPFDLVTAAVSVVNGPRLGSMTIAGRAAQLGTVDRLSLDAGTWLTGPGEIVLSRQAAGPLARRLGSEITVNVPGSPRLRLVGIVSSITNTADAWVSPTQSDVLHAAGAATSRQMLYRFASAGSASALSASVATATAALPAGALSGTTSYLNDRMQANRSIAPWVPFVVAFAVLGLVLAVLVTMNVVNGAVVSGYRTIGVLKTLGFTPRQVVAIYIGQILVPAAIGCVLGVGLGELLAAPLLGRTERAYDLPASAGGVPIWVAVLVAVGAPVLAALAAIGPALHAGRLSAIEAISVGRAPRGGHGYRIRRMLARTRLPRPVSFGLAAPLARPARSAGTVVAIMLGAVTVVFSVGLASSLMRVDAGFSRTAQVPVEVSLASGAGGPGGPGGKQQVNQPGTEPPPAADPVQVLASVRAQAGTAHVVGITQVQVRAVGIAAQVTIQAYDGDATWVGYPMISGRWYATADEVVASSYLLRQTGHHVGDQVTIVGDTGQRRVTIVGECLDGDNDLSLIAGTATLTGVTPAPVLESFAIGLRTGTSPAAYTQALNDALGTRSRAFARDLTADSDSETFIIINGLIATLALLLCTVAALGVFNTVVLNTRERIHEIGVLKAVGMTPRQVRAMVLTSMAGLGVFAGALAVPAGVLLQHRIVPIMADAAGTGLPRSFIDVYGAGELVALGCAGIVLAAIGALVPAGWASRTRVANALRAE